MSKRYVLVEVSDPDPDGGIDAGYVRDSLAGDGHLADEFGVTFRTADVTDWVTPGGNAAFLRSVVAWS